ncbi:hypothetical protein LPJ55_001013 [Coemansia sp. RSA 990]|nr:hypothetical protein LPJ55_001013 [Coemansia sp. RSA 990]KAJ2653449.1 hypothetical protein IWW40_000503 [Coemansia sp. RSA 1250]
MTLAPKRGNRDSGRGSFGLGIVLTESQESQLDPVVSAMPVTPSSAMYEMSLPETTRNSWASSDQQKTAPSMFARLINGISAFMSTTDEQIGPKTRIEDMLESYYMSQDRQVPEWVYNPPPDPPQSTKSQRPTSIIVEQPQVASRESLEPSRESSTKPSSASTSSVLRPFARLNISRLTRPGASTRMRIASPTPSSAPSDISFSMARSGSKLRRVWPQQLSLRSGSSRPSSPSPASRVTPVPVNVRMVDSGNDSESPTLPQFMIDSSQLSAPSSRSQSPFAKLNRRNWQNRAGSEGSQRQPATASDYLSPERDGQLPPVQSHILNPYSMEDTHAYGSASTPASHRRKLSASLPAWVNPSKWRPKTRPTLASPAADEQPQLQKYSEPASGMLATTSNYDSLSQRTRSATPRPGRVKRLFKRKPH